MALRAIAVLVAVVSSPTPAAADPGFQWQAPAACPSAGEVRARIERRLGTPVDGSVHGVAVEIARDGAGYVARIDARALAVATPRTLTSARCDELADAVAVVVARLADEARRAAPRVATATATAEIPGAIEARAARRPGPGRWGGGVRVLAVSGVGTLPGINTAGDLGIYARRGRYFAELAGAWWAPNETYLKPGAPGAVDVGLITLGLRAGWSPPDMYIRGWLGAEVGPMTGEGIALDDPRLGRAPWVAAGAGFGVIWPMFEHVRLTGTIEFMAPFTDVRFVLANGSEIYRPSTAIARCALGLEFGWR